MLFRQVHQNRWHLVDRECTVDQKGDLLPWINRTQITIGVVMYATINAI